MNKEISIENRRKATQASKTYIFKVDLGIDSPKMYTGARNQQMRKGKASWRKFAILGSQTLYDLAETINDVFGFMFDHCFGFYSNLGERTMYDSKEIYELFTDLEDVEHTPGAKGVENVKISQVFKEKGKKMLFYFDYGDGWYFYVTTEAIEKAQAGQFYPVLLSIKGKSPEQYPPLEDEE